MSAAKETVWYLRPKYLFVIFTCANTLLFIDRGIVPGASNEFNAFIKDNVDTSTPDVFLGLLQSAFIVGLAIGSSIFGHLVHYHPRFYLTGLGCAIWMLAVVLSGMARYADSYTFLVFARMLSGVGEASLQVNIPPWIQKTAPPLERGMWLSIFFTAIPVGTATGYAYSSIMAENLGWEWAYFVEAMFMAPLVFFMFTIAHHFPVEHGEEDSGGGHHGVGAYTAPAPTPSPRTSSKDRAADGEPSARLQILPPENTVSEEDRLRARSTSNNSASGAAKKLVSVELGSPVASPDAELAEHAPRRKHKPTVIEEFGVVFSKPLFLCLVAGYAAQTAMLIGLSTFGSAFMMGLGYFNTESQSSTIFGALICMSGVIATPLGGLALDRMLASATQRTNPGAPEQHLQHFDNEAALSGAVGEVVRNAVLEAEYEIEHENLAQTSQRTDATGQLRATDAFAHGQSMSLRQQQTGEQRGESSPVRAGEDSDVLKRRKMDKIAELITISSLVGCGLLCLCYWLHDKFAFLGLVTVGVGILFFCTPAINMGFMLAVPTENQSFGLAMMVVFMHSLGDVPSPILVGLIKDTLAPGCVGDEDDDGQDAATSADCRDDAPGLRMTILLVDLWLLWCVFFFGLVWYLNHYHRHTVEHCTYCVPGGRLCPCVKPHRQGEDGDDSDSDGEGSPQEKNKLLSKLIPSSTST